ncbi:ABC transporter substrate-binding protein [Halomonas sp. CUBES01]|uniref:ABC transporter substrate-binding protein n=1 Tax=Vreelandella gomseomensis TaxID=370766 RepID=A0ABU1G8F7_9GAMM|nr:MULTISPECIES: ABC transporter substrate-binding protein [Halomonas]MDR5873394.1 ABC transporter substrate-binding protein [Halomonas gomseomensis]MEC4768152.1 ABC transporter substrate-binding protein [Halomonas sp. CUBES01]
MTFSSLPIVKNPNILVVFHISLLIPFVSQASEPPSSIALSWTVAETLVALEAHPQGMWAPNKYEEWGSIRSLPESIFDIGLPAQPNLELITELAPDIIMSEAYLSKIDERLSINYNTQVVSTYDSDLDTWKQLTDLTRKLSISIKKQDTAENYIDTIETEIESLKDIVKDWSEPLLIIRALDDSHVRVYGENSLPQAILDRLDLPNAWEKPTTRWGFTVVGIEELIDIEARLVIVKGPGISDERMNQLSNHGLWQHMPSIKEGTVISVPPFWIFGALPSGYQFARNLVDALVADQSISTTQRQ